jgi:hypothetical protein
VQYSLLPWFKRIESSIARDLLTPRERAQYYAEFLAEGLQRGDTESRYNSYSVGRQGGWLSVNEIRQKENMPPIDGGDTYLEPLNMVPAGQQPDAPTPIKKRAIEARSLQPAQVAQARQKLSQAQKRVLADALGRILRREANDVGNRLKKDRAGLVNWLATFYEGHQKFIIRQLMPVLLSYADLVRDLVGQELDEAVPGEWDSWVNRYLERYAARHQGKSLKELAPVIEDDDLDPLPILDKWRDFRPASVAASESVRFNNATAVAMYGSAGVTKKTWATMGDSCPWCTLLNGKTIELEGNFIAAGQELAPGGGHEPMKITGDVKHPQAHNGCDCVVVAG